MSTRHTKSAVDVKAAVGIALCLLLCAGVSLAQGSSADQLADEIATSELAPSTAQKAAPAPQAKDPAGPMGVSVLDIGAKLALLVLLVYGVALGVKQLQKSGFRLGRSGAPAGTETGRIRQCADLQLRGGATLHLVEVDRNPVLLATHGTGDISLILDLRQTAATQPAREPLYQAAPAVQPRVPTTIAPPVARDDSEPRTAPALQQDSEWTQRRDALIRALTERTS